MKAMLVSAPSTTSAAAAPEGPRLSAQFDLTATPKHNNGGNIRADGFATILWSRRSVRASSRRPVLPDAASRGKLDEHKIAKFTEKYQDYLHLGYLEWKKSFDELSKVGKKPVLFVMTRDTKNCDEVAAWLESRYPEFERRVLVIHTKNNGEISESRHGQKQGRVGAAAQGEHAKSIPGTVPTRRWCPSWCCAKAGMCRTSPRLSGCAPISSEAKILPEQTLGRGLRRMFRGQDIDEKVSVVGTPAFMEFVEGIKSRASSSKQCRWAGRARAKARWS